MTTIDHFRRRLPLVLAELEEIVAIESPTRDVEGAGRAAAWLEEKLAPFGRLSREQMAGFGPLLHLERVGTDHRVMLIGHLDTVWPVGSWPELWRESGGRIFGPGIYDMKGGLVFIIELLSWLDATGTEHPTLDIFINPDEEVGSLGSRTIICDAARRADLALVLEPTTPEGVIKLARKGSGEYVLTIHGRSAHQGVEPELGVNAVVEAAHQVGRLLELQDLESGTTVGPNVIRAGSVSNVIPDRAELRIDVRAWTAGEQRRLEEGIAALRPVLKGSRFELTGGWNRPPMEMSPASMAVFERARIIGSDLGLDLKWVRWGGSSDANLTAAVGTPTIDGLGPVGEGSHQRSESIEIDALPARMALFTELVASLTKPIGNS